MKKKGIRYKVILQILLAVTVFLIPLVVSLPQSWLTKQGPVPIFIFVFIGSLAVAFAAYRTEVDRLLELDRKIKEVSADLELRTQQLAQLQIEHELNGLINKLNIPAKIRASVFLKQNSGNLKAVYGVGVEESPDFGLEFIPGTGWAWDSWKTNDRVWCDFEKYGRTKIMQRWKLTDGQFRAINSSGARFHLYTPISYPHQPNKIIGVLAIDSSNSESRTHFNNGKTVVEIDICAFYIARVLVNANIV